MTSTLSVTLMALGAVALAASADLAKAQDNDQAGAGFNWSQDSLGQSGQDPSSTQSGPDEVRSGQPSEGQAGNWEGQGSTDQGWVRQDIYGPDEEQDSQTAEGEADQNRKLLPPNQVGQGQTGTTGGAGAVD